ncbi:MAG TPA: hypothetical protein VK833_11220 [Gillisia sp.]|nr:hypothetical protein [Gillisia sp.]
MRRCIFEAGCINIFENTYKLIKDHFKCRYRGEIKVKNKGMMKMFYVHCAHDDLNLEVILNHRTDIKNDSHSLNNT